MCTCLFYAMTKSTDERKNINNAINEICLSVDATVLNFPVLILHVVDDFDELIKKNENFFKCQ